MPLDEEVPDEFFEVTERDVRLMWEDQQKKAYVVNHFGKRSLC